MAALAIATGTVGASHRQAVDPPSPASGHSQVVATWLVDLEAGQYEWNVAGYEVDATGIDLTHTVPTFLIGYGDAATTITGPEVRGRLADGEALFRRPTLTTHAAANGAQPATIMEWTISHDDTGPGSDPFEPGAGLHDIDIVRDALDPSETFTMKAGIPAFVMVTTGWVTAPDGTRIDAGGWATLQGDIVLTNGGDETAVVLATWISPVLDPPAPAPSVTEAPATTLAPPPPAAPAPTNAPPGTAAPASTTTWPSTTIAGTTTTWVETTSTTMWPDVTVVETTEW